MFERIKKIYNKLFNKVLPEFSIISLRVKNKNGQEMTVFDIPSGEYKNIEVQVDYELGRL